jgi:hypothetical protein
LKLRLRADNGFATPALYELCEAEKVEYFGIRSTITVG